MAAEPEEGSLTAWIDVLKRPTEPERVRSAVLSALRSRLWRSDEPLSAEVRKSLVEIWNDPQSQLSFSLRQQLDGVVQATDREFEGSAERCDVWLSNLLTLTPELCKSDNQTENLAYSVLRGLAEKHPGATGRRLTMQLLNPEWPALYRRAMACALLTAYRNADQVGPNWESTLQAYFVDLMYNGEPFPMRVAARDLEYFSAIKSPDGSGIRRSYLPGAKLMTALKVGTERLQSASNRPGANQEFTVAASELARVVKLLEAQSDP